MSMLIEKEKEKKDKSRLRYTVQDKVICILPSNYAPQRAGFMRHK